MAADNKMLGRFNLVGLPPAPKGVPQIEVTFDIDANGIVHVSAKDKATGKEQAIRIQSSGGLTENDIQKMVKEAEMFKEKDVKRKNAIEEKNKLESLIIDTEKNLTTFKGKIPASDDELLRAEITKVRTILSEADPDPEALKAAGDSLRQLTFKTFEQVYKNAPSSESEQQSSSSSSNEQPPEAEETKKEK